MNVIHKDENFLAKHKHKLIGVMSIFSVIVASVVLYMNARKKVGTLKQTYIPEVYEQHKENSFKDTQQKEHIHTHKQKEHKQKYTKKNIHKNAHKEQQTQKLEQKDTHIDTQNLDEHIHISPKRTHIRLEYNSKANKDDVIQKVMDAQRAGYRHTHKDVYIQDRILKAHKQNIQTALVYIYNIERRIQCGMRIDDEIVRQYKQVSIILYDYILYDSNVYTKCIDSIHTDMLNIHICDYNMLVKQAVNKYIMGVICSSEYNNLNTFIMELSREIYDLHELTKYTNDQTKVMTYLKYDKDIYSPKLRVHNFVKHPAQPTVHKNVLQCVTRTTLTFVSVSDVEIKELADSQNTQELQIKNKFICLNIGNTMTVESVVRTLHTNTTYGNIQYVPMNEHCLRAYMLPYVLNHAVADTENGYNGYINAGYIMSISIEPYTLQADYGAAREIYDEDITSFNLSNAGIVYVGCNMNLFTLSDFTNTLNILKRANSKITSQLYHMCARGNTGITTATQLTDAPKRGKLFTTYPQFYIHSSSVNTTHLMTDCIPRVYSEVNIVQNIPLGSVVIKTCLEIVDAYFNLLMNSKHMSHMRMSEQHKTTHTEELYTKMYVFIDVPEHNIYSSSKYAIRDMYTKAMSYILIILNEQRNDILPLLIKHNSDLKQNFEEAYKYLRKLQVIIVHTDTNKRDKNHLYTDEYHNLAIKHEECVQKAYTLRSLVPFISRYTLEQIINDAIIRSNISLKRLEDIKKQHSEIYKIHRMCEEISEFVLGYMTQASDMYLHEKYKLKQLEYEGKYEDYDFMKSLSVCKIQAKKLSDILKYLKGHIAEIIKQHKFDIKENDDNAFNTLIHDLNIIDQIKDACMLMMNMCKHNAHIQHTNDQELICMLNCNEHIVHMLHSSTSN